MHVHHFRFLLPLLLFAVSAPLAATETVSPDTQQSGTLLVGQPGAYRVATRLDTDIEMQVTGLVADVHVRQAFRNDGQEWAEGTYVFPLPANATVRGMRIRIGERLIEGEVREKQAAVEAYAQARAEGRKASLVQQQRRNLFTTRVANIGPGEEVVIEIDYIEDIDFDSGRFRIRFPLTLTPRYIPGQPIADRVGSSWSADTDRVTDASTITPPMTLDDGGHRVSMTIDIAAGTRLKRIVSRYHGVDVTENQGRYRVVLASSDVRPDHDFELYWIPNDSVEPAAMAFTETVDGDTHTLVMVTPPTVADTPAIAGRELIFVIDTSGSMQGVSIEQARAALKLAIGRLAAHDRFNVIQFNSATSALFPQSVAATPERIALAQAYVDSLAANGGTEMRPALELALRAGTGETELRQIVFITDGAIGNEDELFRVVERELANARLFTVGIGSAPNGWFMQKAAETGRGTYTMVSALNEVGEKMQQLFDKLESPQLTDIRIRWPGRNPVTQYPAQIADLYLGEPVVVKARLAGMVEPGDTLTVSGNSPAGAWSVSVPLAAAGERPGVAALWARARIAGLIDDERRGADKEAVRSAVVSLGLAHSLVSKYTSLVAVDKTPSRPRGETLRRDAVPNLVAHGQRPAAVVGMPATATPSGKLLLSGLALLLCAGLLLALFRICTMQPVRRKSGPVRRKLSNE